MTTVHIRNELVSFEISRDIEKQRTYVQIQSKINWNRRISVTFINIIPNDKLVVTEAVREWLRNYHPNMTDSNRRIVIKQVRRQLYPSKCVLL